MPSNFKALAGASGGEPTDPNFKNVTLLLHGDGSNGAQNNTFLDSSTNNFTITRNGNTTQGSFSPYGSNWSNFNPNSDNGIGVASNAALNMGTGDFTVEAWVNTAQLPTTNSFQTSPGGFQAVFGTGPNLAGTGSQLYIGVTNLKFDIASDGGGPIDVAHNMVAGQWYHVAITRSGTTFRAFINGVLVQTATGISTSWVDGYGWGIMRAEPIGGYGGAWWYGYVSNLRVVKGTAVYTAAFTPSTTPLTAITNTSLLTCQSNRFRDASTNNFTITRNGDVKVTNFAPFAPSSAYSTSTNGGSGYFDGSGDYLTLGSNAAYAPGSGDFTWECWVYPTATPGVFWITDTSGGLQIGFQDASTWGVARAVIQWYMTSTTLPTNFMWNHIAVTRSGSNMALFLNGTRIATKTSATADFSTGSTAIMANLSGVSATAGYTTDIRLVKGTAIYDPTVSTYTVPTAPLTAVTNTGFLAKCQNAAIFDNSMKNDLETVGNAQISTSVKKFGTGSMSFGSATTDALYVASQNTFDISTGNFTLEFWVNFNGFGSDKKYAIQISGSSYWQLVHDSSFGISLRVTGYSEVVGQGSNTGWSTGTWYHVALVRNGNTFTIYRNGTSIATATNSNSLGFYPNTNIGGYASNNSLNAYIDDMRLTKGVARYTANFTPPTAAFPNK